MGICDAVSRLWTLVVARDWLDKVRCSKGVVLLVGERSPSQIPNSVLKWAYCPKGPDERLKLGEYCDLPKARQLGRDQTSCPEDSVPTWMGGGRQGGRFVLQAGNWGFLQMCIFLRQWVRNYQW